MADGVQAAQVLADHYNEVHLLLDETSDVLRQVDEATVQDAINVLRLYEAEHKVVFTAVPA